MMLTLFISYFIILMLGGCANQTEPVTLEPSPTFFPLDLARTPIPHNEYWIPVEQNFDGVTMVLVPAGCFQMGNDPEGYYAREDKTLSYVLGIPDAGIICFDQPFWIDKYEVTNAQFAQFQGVAAASSYFTGSNRPRDQITWFEARDFCAKRGARLPTEAEWEYAARGVDNLIYPWGYDWNEDNVVMRRNESQGTANVGSKPAGKSWVGAMDMSGNADEWVNSLYRNYPYNAEDGRENTDPSNDDRVIRGGGWKNLHDVEMRATFRGSGVPPYASYFLFGFRCVRATVLPTTQSR